MKGSKEKKMPTLEELKEQVRKERSKAEVERNFKARDEEKKRLQKELFELRHRKGIATAQRLYRGGRAFGRGVMAIGRGFAEAGRSLEGTRIKKTRTKRPSGDSIEKEIMRYVNMG